MSGAKEIKNQIKSIKSTQKITRAMEMVAASKMKRCHDRMFASEPYTQRITKAVNHLAAGHLEYKHEFLIERTVTRVGYIVVSSNRGLCGGLNINLFKKIVHNMSEWKKKDIPVDVGVIGRKAHAFFSRYGASMIASTLDIGDHPTVKSLVGVTKIFLDAYNDKEIDRLFLCHNKFVNTLTQEPNVQQLLPIVDPFQGSGGSHWDYLYEPEPVKLLNMLLNRYVESMIYQAVVENVACEQAARMVAMKSASDNAGELISEFQLIYNKARQAAITQELSEIVAGAAAV